MVISEAKLSDWIDLLSYSQNIYHTDNVSDVLREMQELLDLTHCKPYRHPHLEPTFEGRIVHPAQYTHEHRRYEQPC